MRLFLFGSLMDLDVLSIVLGRRVAPEELRTGYLDGYQRSRVEGEHYPVLVERPGQVVEGLVFAPRHHEDVDRIDFFEGVEYAFAPQTIRLASGDTVAAYVCAGDPDDLATDEPWSLAHWRATAKPSFLEMARSYMAYYGHLDAESAEAVWEHKKAELAGLADESLGHVPADA